MKNLLIITLLLLTSITFGQENNLTKTSDNPFELFYILDSYWIPPHIKEYKTDNSPNYIQVSNGMVLITGRLRGKELYFHGKIQDIKVTTDSLGSKTTSFYAMGKERSVGKMASFELIEKSNGDLIVNYFSKYKKNNFFNSHKATLKEIDKIKAYWKK